MSPRALSLALVGVTLPTLSDPRAAIALTLLGGWMVLYLLYRVARGTDFGIPVRRRLLRTRLHVADERNAEVPMWWSDLQVRRAIKSHWKQALRDTVSAGQPRGREAGRH